MRISFILFLSFIFLSPLYIKAQIPYINSREVIQKGIEQFDSGNYKKSIEYYRQVHECDTNYSTAIYEEINSLIADSAYTMAYQLTQSGIRLPDANKRDFLILLGNIYDYENKSDSAIFIYDSLIRLYPLDHQPWHEIGIAYFLRKKYDLAAYYFQKAILINPYHFRSHYMLGSVYALQGRLSEAVLALETSLLLTKNVSQARLSINILSSIVDETDEINKAYNEKNEKYSNPVFDEIDQILNAKIALNKEYKLKISINDNFFRQTQAMMEKLRFEPLDTTFAMQYYVPMFTEVYKQDMFEPYMLLLFSNFGIESVDDLAKKKSKEVEETGKIVFPYLTNIQCTREINYNKRKETAEKYHYYPSDDFILIGKIKKGEDKIIPQGKVTLYRNNLSLLGEGYYSDKGDKEGLWKYYYSSGQLKSEETYKGNVLIDTFKEYYSNGNLRKITIMDHNGIVREEFEYTYKGILDKYRKRKPDKEVEETSYYTNGQKESTIFLNDGNIKDGTYTNYYKNRRIKEVVIIKNKKYSGIYTKYYDNGNINEKCMYEDGSPEGFDTSFYDNGKMNGFYTCHKGKYDGDFTEYHNNGVLAETGTYHKGKKTGMDMKYSVKGRKYAEIEIKDDVPVSLKYFDEANKEIYNLANKNGLYNYSLFYTNGNKYADMKINEEGALDGNLSYYFYTGSKNNEVNYKSGNKEGMSVSYYKNGGKRTEESYSDDKPDGYYISFYDNGIVWEEGWYKNGNKQGLWKTYSVNGKEASEIYYLNDYINGYRKTYNINGELFFKDMFDYDMLVGTVMYDSAGNAYDSTTYPRGNGHYRMPFKNGGLYFEVGLKNGLVEGPSTKRFINGALNETDYFREGKKDSTCIVYYPNGVKQMEGIYRNGAKDGKWQYYNEAGELTDDENYVNGELEGPRKFYACNTLCIAYNFLNGDKDSAQVYYGENGKIACILYYWTGDIEGYSYEGKDGKLLPEIPVKNGTAKITAYYSNGKKSVEMNVVEDMFVGKQKIYYSNGQIAEERNYKGRNLDGPFKQYTPDGKLCYEVTYKDDKENGLESTYDKNGAIEISKEYYFGSPHGTTTVTHPDTKKTETFTYHYGELINTGE